MKDAPVLNATPTQVVATLKAARDVAETIETVRESMREAGLAEAEHRRRENELLLAAERLCNLLELLMSWLGMLSGGERDLLEGGILELRGKLLAMGVKLVGDKTQEIIDQAEGIVIHHEVFPLGISMRFGEALTMLRGTIDSLGGIDAMPEDVIARIASAEELIKKLRDMEKAHGRFAEF